MDAAQIIRRLGLRPHPSEGGFFRETYRSPDALAMHRLRSDEIFHCYRGDPLTLLMLYADGQGETKTLGMDIEAGQQLQVPVPRGVWQGLFLNEGGSFALLGTTMAPGFDYEDFELGERESLARLYPEFSSLIRRLTPED